MSENKLVYLIPRLRSSVFGVSYGVCNSNGSFATTLGDHSLICGLGANLGDTWNWCEMNGSGDTHTMAATGCHDGAVVSTGSCGGGVGIIDYNVPCVNGTGGEAPPP